ncbi:MAG TPA: single-stranded DNA-binding protein [Candidatus Salinicoccus stercoripullorum]|uniref:Single-stranded DNA-binding protein n=1 Tax=Candidatus Salinicoccus stercoripullorum TaxID=2838756 RepID=A0A9D1QJ41_9STAP|nr:single-stranded DNA-binding protein [Candidatus Salinicoccus stercoripullorum]
MMNKVLLVGELVKNVTLSQTSNGSINSFIIATIRVPKDERKSKEIHFIYCKAFGKAIPGILSRAREGEILCVSGQVASTTHTKPNGEKEYGMEIWAESVKPMPQKMSDQKDLGNPSKMIGDAIRYYDHHNIVTQKSVHVLNDDRDQQVTSGRDDHLEAIEKIIGEVSGTAAVDDSITEADAENEENEHDEEKALA